MKLTYIIILLLSISFLAEAQNVLLQQDVNKDTIIPNKGPNRKFFTSYYFGFGSIFGPSNADSAIPMQNFKSWEFHYGTSFKIKATNWYSLVINMDYSRQAFFKTPDTTAVKYDKLIMNNAGAAVLNRINFGKRGNSVGNYIEIGASARYAFIVRNKLLTVNEDKDPEYKSTKFTFNGPKYVNRLNYYADVRVGFKQYIIYGKYLLSDIINKNPTGQYPAFTAGFMINIGAK